MGLEKVPEGFLIGSNRHKGCLRVLQGLRTGSVRVLNSLRVPKGSLKVL